MTRACQRRYLIFFATLCLQLQAPQTWATRGDAKTLHSLTTLPKESLIANPKKEATSEAAEDRLFEAFAKEFSMHYACQLEDTDWYLKRSFERLKNTIAQTPSLTSINYTKSKLNSKINAYLNAESLSKSSKDYLEKISEYTVRVANGLVKARPKSELGIKWEDPLGGTRGILASAGLSDEASEWNQLGPQTLFDIPLSDIRGQNICKEDNNTSVAARDLASRVRPERLAYEISQHEEASVPSTTPQASEAAQPAIAPATQPSQPAPATQAATPPSTDATPPWPQPTYNTLPPSAAAQPAPEVAPQAPIIKHTGNNNFEVQVGTKIKKCKGVDGACSVALGREAETSSLAALKIFSPATLDVLKQHSESLKVAPKGQDNTILAISESMGRMDHGLLQIALQEKSKEKGSSFDPNELEVMRSAFCVSAQLRNKFPSGPQGAALFTAYRKGLGCP